MVSGDRDLYVFWGGGGVLSGRIEWVGFLVELLVFGMVFL